LAFNHKCGQILRLFLRSLAQVKQSFGQIYHLNFTGFQYNLCLLIHNSRVDGQIYRRSKCHHNAAPPRSSLS